MSQLDRYKAEPNRLYVKGEHELDAIAVSLLVDSSGVHICARTGSVTKQTFDLSYDDITSVETIQNLSYDLVLHNGTREYHLTNVAADSDRIAEIVEAIRDSLSGGTDDSQATMAGSDGPSKNGQASGKAPVERLEKWADLCEQGVINENELQKKKRELLNA